MMKPEDVTGRMHSLLFSPHPTELQRKLAMFDGEEQKAIIAAAYNAVTAEQPTVDHSEL